jgi:hypothetical protein
MNNGDQQINEKDLNKCDDPTEKLDIHHRSTTRAEEEEEEKEFVSILIGSNFCFALLTKNEEDDARCL